MIEEEKAVFTTYLAGLAEIFETTLSQTRVDLYFEALADLPMEYVVKSCNILARTARFFPKPAEIREILGGNGNDAPLIAFDVMRRTVRSLGAYKSVSFEDPTIMAVIQSLGGWIKVCDTPSEEWKWLEKDFVKLYQAFKMCPIEAPASLPGIIEQQNFAKGLAEDIPQPVRIGEGPKRLEAVKWLS